MLVTWLWKNTLSPWLSDEQDMIYVTGAKCEEGVLNSLFVGSQHFKLLGKIFYITPVLGQWVFNCDNRHIIVKEDRHCVRDYQTNMWDRPGV